MKKLRFLLIVTALLCAVLALCVTTSAATYSGTFGADGDNLTWTLDTDTGVLEIDGTGAMADYSSPSSNSVPWYSFRSSVKSVTLGDGVTSIGNDAFLNCQSLTSVDMPSVTSIGDGAFYYCKSLTNVDIPECATSIGSYAFNSCSNLKKATIYSKTATFDSYVFDDTHADFEIHGYTGSTAETYANNNGYTFVPLDSVAPGDADGNGEITIRDAALILQYIAGWDVEVDEEAADADGNGEITIRDAALILQFIAGWDVTLG